MFAAAHNNAVAYAFDWNLMCGGVDIESASSFLHGLFFFKKKLHLREKKPILIERNMANRFKLHIYK